MREVLRAFRARELTAGAAAQALGLGRSRFYELYADYLRACASRRHQCWLPPRSGGNHQPAWPPEVEPLVRKLLSAHPPASYSLTASEVRRRLHFAVDPATIRRFALQHGLFPPKPPAKLLRKPKARSSAATRTGKIASRLSSPPSKSTIWPAPMPSCRICSGIAMRTSATGNCARLRWPPGKWPPKKSVRL